MDNLNIENELYHPELTRQLTGYKWRTAVQFIIRQGNINDTVLVESKYDEQGYDTHHILINSIGGLHTDILTTPHGVKPNTTYDQIDIRRWCSTNPTLV